jgi:hypothetical protein
VPKRIPQQLGVELLRDDAFGRVKIRGAAITIVLKTADRIDSIAN